MARTRRDKKARELRAPKGGGDCNHRQNGRNPGVAIATTKEQGAKDRYASLKIKEGASQVLQRPFREQSGLDYGVIVTVFGTGLVLLSVPTSVHGLPEVALESE